MRYKIVIDSCGELIERWKEDPAIERASLTLTVDEEDIVDDESFDQAYFLKEWQNHRTVPNPHVPPRRDIWKPMTVRQTMCMQ